MKHSARNIFSNVTLLFSLNILASALNYVYQVLAAKVMRVEDYGIINAVFSFITIVAVPGTMLTMIAARRIALYNATGALSKIKPFVNQMMRGIVFLSGLVVLILIVLNRFLIGLLNLSGVFQLVIITVICALGYFHPFFSGCMSGFQSFGVLGVYALAIPCYKLIGLFLAEKTAQSARLNVSLVSIALGSVVTMFIGVLYIKIKTRGYTSAESENVDYVELIDVFIINLGMTLYLNADILAIRRFSDDKVTGLYSAASLFGRMIYYLAATLGTVLIPGVASATKKNAKQLVKYMLGIIFFVTMLSAIVMKVYGAKIISFMYGENYVDSYKYLPYVVLISFAMSGIAVLANYVVGIGQTRVFSHVMILMVVTVLTIIGVKGREQIKLLGLGIVGVLFTLIFLGLEMSDFEKVDI